MGKRSITEIHITRGDLWSGATDNDVLAVVQALQARGWNAYRVSGIGTSNVEDPLRFASDFYDVVLSTLRTAAERAERRAKDKVVKTIVQERARLESARAERDRFQAEVEALESRINLLISAAETFEEAVRTANGA